MPNEGERVCPGGIVGSVAVIGSELGDYRIALSALQDVIEGAALRQLLDIISFLRDAITAAAAKRRR